MKRVIIGIIGIFIILPIVNSIGLTYDARIILRGNLTDSFNGSVTIKNPNEYSIGVNINISGDIKDYSLSENYMIMTPGDTKEISFELFPTEDGTFENSVDFSIQEEEGFGALLSTSVLSYVGVETETTTTIPEPTPTTTQPQQQSSGGSSGGGGTKIPEKSVIEENVSTTTTTPISSISLTIRPVKMILRGNVTEEMEGSFNLTNPNEFPIHVNITPTFNETIVYEIQPYVDLDVEETKQVNFTLTHSCTGTYHNSILLRATAEGADMYMESLAYVEVDVQTIITSPELLEPPKPDYMWIYIAIIIIIILAIIIFLAFNKGFFKKERRSTDVRENKE